MQGKNSAFGEGCRMVGECCLMFAQAGEDFSAGRIVLCLKRAQDEAIDTNGSPNVALQLAIRRLQGW